MTRRPVIKAIIGIGNIETPYFDTRHSIGLQFIDGLALERSVPMTTDVKQQAVVGRAMIGEREVLLASSIVPMNRSGEAVGRIVDAYGLRAEDVLIVHDDLDLSPGAARMKEGGGFGGHNGLRHIAEQWTGDFVRLRLGVGRPEPGADIIDYVVSRPEGEEAEAITRAMEEARGVIDTWVSAGAFQAMNQLHAPPAPAPAEDMGMEFTL